MRGLYGPLTSTPAGRRYVAIWRWIHLPFEGCAHIATRVFLSAAIHKGRPDWNVAVRLPSRSAQTLPARIAARHNGLFGTSPRFANARTIFPRPGLPPDSVRLLPGAPVFGRVLRHHFPAVQSSDQGLPVSAGMLGDSGAFRFPVRAAGRGDPSASERSGPAPRRQDHLTRVSAARERRSAPAYGPR